MSFWFYGKKRGGRRSLYSVSLPVFFLPVLIAAILVVALSILRGCFGN